MPAEVSHREFLRLGRKLDSIWAQVPVEQRWHYPFYILQLIRVSIRFCIWDDSIFASFFSGVLGYFCNYLAHYLTGFFRGDLLQMFIPSGMQNASMVCLISMALFWCFSLYRFFVSCSERFSISESISQLYVLLNNNSEVDWNRLELLLESFTIRDLQIEISKKRHRKSISTVTIDARKMEHDWLCYSKEIDHNIAQKWTEKGENSLELLKQMSLRKSSADREVLSRAIVKIQHYLVILRREEKFHPESDYQEVIRKAALKLAILQEAKYVLEENLKRFSRADTRDELSEIATEYGPLLTLALCEAEALFHAEVME